MPRPPSTPTTALGRAIQAKRADSTGRAVAHDMGISGGALYRIEAGQRRPSADTARALARWLGWTMEQVLDAAVEPVEDVASRAEQSIVPEVR